MLTDQKQPDILGMLWDALMKYAITRLIVALAIALALVIWGIVYYYGGLNLINNGVTTEGVIVSIKEERRAKSGSVIQYATVEYKDAKGEIYQMQTSQHKGSNEYKEGDKLEITYLPNKPKKAELKRILENTVKNSFPFHWLLFIGSLFFWAAVAYNIYFMARYKTIW